jgi:hypothetical protein
MESPRPTSGGIDVHVMRPALDPRAQQNEQSEQRKPRTPQEFVPRDRFDPEIFNRTYLGK